MQRRQILLGATAVLSSFAGCLGIIRSEGSLREITVDLTNADDQARTFHFALEAQEGMLDWESHRVDAGVNKEVQIPLDENVSPVALHGVVADFSGSVDVLGVDNLEEDYCLRFNFRALRPSDEHTQIAFVADTRC